MPSRTFTAPKIRSSAVRTCLLDATPLGNRFESPPTWRTIGTVPGDSRMSSASASIWSRRPTVTCQPAIGFCSTGRSTGATSLTCTATSIGSSSPTLPRRSRRRTRPFTTTIASGWKFACRSGYCLGKTISSTLPLISSSCAISICDVAERMPRDEDAQRLLLPAEFLLGRRRRERGQLRDEDLLFLQCTEQRDDAELAIPREARSVLEGGIERPQLFGAIPREGVERAALDQRLEDP